MSTVLLLTGGDSTEALPALSLLLHTVRVSSVEMSALIETPEADVVLVDGRNDLGRARDTCRLVRTTEGERPALAVVTEGGLAAVTADWRIDDVVVDTAGPAEVEARLRLAVGRAAEVSAAARASQIRAGDLAIDEDTYTARLRGSPLDLTFKEFELLRYLAQHPGRVFTRAQLLLEVWGYDYFGGTRTVDVHIRRLRAKFGAEHESMIGTVRGVGYRFLVPGKPGRRSAHGSGRSAASQGVDHDGHPPGSVDSRSAGQATA